MNDDEIRDKQTYIWPEVIAAVITKNDQEVNLCPIAYQAISTIYEKPLTVCIGLSNDSYTLSSVLKNGEFTFTYPAKKQLKDILYCGTVSGRAINKLDNTQLVFDDASKIKSPLLVDAVVNYECRVIHYYDVGSYTVVLGEILLIHGSDKTNLDKIYAFGGDEDEYGVIQSLNTLQKGRF